jgi:tRNA(adenine34) deaminase
VTTTSTAPPPGLFTRDAATIAGALASPRVSPGGPVSGLRMLLFFLNRAGRGLSAARRRELRRAQRLLQQRIARGGPRRGRGPS